MVRGHSRFVVRQSVLSRQTVTRHGSDETQVLSVWTLNDEVVEELDDKIPSLCGWRWTW